MNTTVTCPTCNGPVNLRTNACRCDSGPVTVTPSTEPEARAIALDHIIAAARDLQDEVGDVASPLDHLTIEEGQGAVQWVINQLSDLRSRVPTDAR